MAECINHATPTPPSGALAQKGFRSKFRPICGQHMSQRNRTIASKLLLVASGPNFFLTSPGTLTQNVFPTSYGTKTIENFTLE
jgi:hypothetical protein